MPVVGHALMGLATAAVVDPPQEPGHRNRVRLLAASYWSLLLVALAYLPDIVTQAGITAGWGVRRQLGHSLLFAVVAALAIAVALIPLGRRWWRRTALVAFFSIALHDLADILQASGRQPLWPVSDWRPDAVANVLPKGLAGELLVFVPLAVAAYGFRRWRQPGRAARGPRPGLSRARALSTAAIIVIAASAVATSHLRGAHERALRQARALVLQGNYAGAMEAAQRADLWPSAVRPGRTDYVRAEAARGAGDWHMAEQYYLRSHRADPGYFWTVADLAALYASAPAPQAERRRLVKPWVAILRSRFASHYALAQTLARVERALARTPAGPGKPSGDS